MKSGLLFVVMCDRKTKIVFHSSKNVFVWSSNPPINSKKIICVLIEANNYYMTTFCSVWVKLHYALFVLHVSCHLE